MARGAHPRLRRVGVVLAATAMAISLVTSGSATAGLSTNATGLRVLETNVLPGLSQLVPTGAPPAGELREVGIGLQRPHVAEEEALYRRLYDPTSADYHRFLSPAAFSARFGVDAAAFRATLSWLRSGGLRVAHAATTRDYVLVQGTVAQLERRFRTPLRTFDLKGIQFVANTLAPAVPATLPVLSVIGLNDLQRWQRFPGGSQAPAATPNTGLLSPAELWSIYEQPADNLGDDQTIAVFGNGKTDQVIRDLRTFEKQHGFPEVPVVVKRAGVGPFVDDSGSVEWALDTQAATGMAPHLKRVDLYFAPKLVDADVAAMFSKWANDPDGPRQANASFGTCEMNPLNPVFGNPTLQPETPPTQQLGNNLQPVSENILRQATMEGRTLFASTGDTGSSCAVLVLPVIYAGNGVLNQGVPLLTYPAASPYAVGVGGTVLYADGAARAGRYLERAWEFGGGGTSVFLNAPEYQRGLPNLIGRCVTDPTGALTNTLQPCRGLPDVSAISGDVLGNGYGIVVDGHAGSQGAGTSLSAPLWVGMWARMQAASTEPKGVGFANPALYRVGRNPAAYASSFYDVTLGTNGLFVAQSGWDYVTGWGTPRLTSLMRAIVGRTAPVRHRAT